MQFMKGDLCMHSFKEVLKSSVSVLLVTFILFGIVIGPYSVSECDYYCDCKYRKELAGTIDTLFLGASQGVRCFVPEIINQKLGCSSYNLSGKFLTWHAREALLLEEIKRNPIKTLFLEISSDSLQRGNETGLEGNSHVLLRLNGFGKKVKYFLSETSSDEYDDMLSLFSRQGFTYYMYKLMGKEKGLDRNAFGYSPGEAYDMTIDRTNISKEYNSETFDSNYDSENLETLERMIKLCKQYKIQVYLIVVPVSDKKVWQMSALDNFDKSINMLSQKLSCRYINFNLLKSRYEKFSDKTSFCDETHLADSGAKIFSEILANTVLKINNNTDIKKEFYLSYSEMRNDSPYMENLYS